MLRDSRRAATAIAVNIQVSSSCFSVDPRAARSPIAQRLSPLALTRGCKRSRGGQRTGFC